MSNSFTFFSLHFNEMISPKGQTPFFLLLFFSGNDTIKSSIDNICKIHVVNHMEFKTHHPIPLSQLPLSSLSIILSELSLSIKWLLLDLHYIIYSVTAKLSLIVVFGKHIFQEELSWTAQYCLSTPVLFWYLYICTGHFCVVQQTVCSCIIPPSFPQRSLCFVTQQCQRALLYKPVKKTPGDDAVEFAE